MEIDFKEVLKKTAVSYRESLQKDSRVLKDFEAFKTVVDDLGNSDKEGLLWIVFISFLGSVSALALSENASNGVDDFEARLSFIEKDIGNFKRILKRLDKVK